MLKLALKKKLEAERNPQILWELLRALQREKFSKFSCPQAIFGRKPKPEDSREESCKTLLYFLLPLDRLSVGHTTRDSAAARCFRQRVTGERRRRDRGKGYRKGRSRGPTDQKKKTRRSKRGGAKKRKKNGVQPAPAKPANDDAALVDLRWKLDNAQAMRLPHPSTLAAGRRLSPIPGRSSCKLIL